VWDGCYERWMLSNRRSGINLDEVDSLGAVQLYPPAVASENVDSAMFFAHKHQTIKMLLCKGYDSRRF